MKFTGERVVPWAMLGTKQKSFCEHVQRYAWATKWAAGKRIVDLGCGCGYGTHILSMVAKFAMGVDVSAEAIVYAKGHFERPTCQFYQADIEAMVTTPHDVYIAFEVLEHLASPAALVKRLHGTLLWSLPIDRTSAFHKHDYDRAGAEALMGGSEFWYQRGVVIVPQARAWFGPDNVLGILKKE